MAGGVGRETLSDIVVGLGEWVKLFGDDASWCTGSRIEMAGGIDEGQIVGCFVWKGRQNVAEEVVSSAYAWNLSAYANLKSRLVHTSIGTT